LTLTIPIPENLQSLYQRFCQFKEVHRKGIVLAWQASYDHHKKSVIIGVAGTKSFHGHVRPDVNGEFALDRGLVQLQMIHSIFPHLLDLVLAEKSSNRELTIEDLKFLESTRVAQRWVGVRSVASDGFITSGYLKNQNGIVPNATTLTHLGSGGVSFGPASVVLEEMNRIHNDPNRFFKANILTKMAVEKKPLMDKVSHYADPTRRY
jgi:hypothetical protein